MPSRRRALDPRCGGGRRNWPKEGSGSGNKALAGVPPGVRCKREARKAAKGVLVRRMRKAKDKDHLVKESPPAGGAAAGLKGPCAGPGRTAGEDALAAGLAASAGGAACVELAEVGRPEPEDRLRTGALAGSEERPGGPHRAAKSLRARGAPLAVGPGPLDAGQPKRSRRESSRTKGGLQFTGSLAWEALGTWACEAAFSALLGPLASLAELHPRLRSDGP